MAVYALGDSVPEIHPDAYVHPEATVIGSVRIGAHSTVWPQAVLRGDYGHITVGASQPHFFTKLCEIVALPELAADPRFKLEAERQVTPWKEGVDGAYVACLRLAPA